jgi:rhodanese-related sulfurtransferase
MIMNTTLFLSIIGVFCFCLVIVKKFLKTRGIPMIDAETAKKIVDNNDAIILDVRTHQEFITGHLIGARLIPVAELPDRIEEIASYKNNQILVYCRGGNRSATASAVLKTHGFLKIANLKGGIMAWVSHGYPIVKETRA